MGNIFFCNLNEMKCGIKISKKNYESETLGDFKGQP